MCTKGFLNYLSAKVVFLNVVFKDEIVNCQNGLGKPRKFSRSRMTKRTAQLNSSREI